MSHVDFLFDVASWTIVADRGIGPAREMRGEDMSIMRNLLSRRLVVFLVTALAILAAAPTEVAADSSSDGGGAGLVRAAEDALSYLRGTRDDTHDGPLPTDCVLDGIEWRDGLPHLKLTLNVASEDWTLAPTALEEIARGLADALDPLREAAGLVVLARRDGTDTYRPLDDYVPVVVPGIYEQPEDEMPSTIERPWTPVPAIGEPEPQATTDYQPSGALSGVVVYTSAGHGWTAGSSSWVLQRPLLLSMIEDYGNIDQLNFFAEYCFAAGATVVPFRPIGHQSREVVLDQDDPEVTYTGAWANSTSSPYYENGRTNSGFSYRFAAASAAETAVARYTPNLPITDFYPVYTWVLDSTNRTTQKYRISHTGGTSEVVVDHRLVGKGWVWLGNYHFAAGTGGFVEISNQSSAGGNAIADAIRFGNGTGDLIGAGPGTISGYPREEEASRYWAESETNVNANGMSSSIYNCCSSDIDDNIGTAARWAREMNNASVGNRWNRVYLEFHSNASSGTARGAVALITGSATTNQALLADIMGEEVEEDMEILDGIVPFEHTWASRPNTYTSSFGAISTTNNGNEFDATIIEVAFHDNTQDAELLRDVKVRDALGRASMHGIIKFLNSISGGAVPLAFPPDRPRRVQVVHNGSGGIVVSWQAPLSGEAYGDPAAGYRVFRSSDGYGFDSGQDVGNVVSAVLNDIAADTTTYLRVAAYNAGGRSLPSETLAVRRPATGPAEVLIVNGFDRVDRLMNSRQTIPAGTFDRQIARRVNSFDYTVQHATALSAAGVSFDACANEAIIDGTVQLGDYTAVVWILGEESVADRTFDNTEQSRVTAYLNGGGGLFVTGSEIAWDLDAQNNGRIFFENLLGGNYLGDDAATYDAAGSGGILSGVGSFTFAPASGAPYDVEFPDSIGPLGGAATVVSYLGGSNDSAGIQLDAGTYRVVMFGFPFETITLASKRTEIMTQVMDFLVLPATPPADYDDDLDVDMNDYAHLQECMSGSFVPQNEPECQDAKLDADSDVDDNDLSIFIGCMSGANVPADPLCAN